MPGAKTIYIVDDDIFICKGLTGLLSEVGYEVRSFASAAALLSCGSLDRPGCLLLDVCTADQSAFDLQRFIQNGNGRVPVIFMTGDGDVAMAVRAMKAGAIDFLIKPLSRSDLLAAVARALAKCDELRGAHRRQLRARELIASLTPREREVFDLVVMGKRNKEIASALGSQEATVKVHRSRVMRKLGTRSFAELMRFGLQYDLVPNVHDDRADPRREVTHRTRAKSSGRVAPDYIAGGVPLPAGGLD